MPKKAKPIDEYWSKETCACERTFADLMEAEGFTMLSARRFYDHTAFEFTKGGIVGTYDLTRQNNNLERLRGCVEEIKEHSQRSAQSL